MDIDRRARRIDRIIEAETVVDVRVSDQLHQPDTCAVHCLRFQKPFAAFRIDQYDLRAVRFFQALGHGFRDPPGSEILAFHIKRLFHRGDDRKLGGFDLDDLFATVIFRCGARNTDGDVAETDIEPLRPGRIFLRQITRLRQLLIRCAFPSQPRDFAERPCRLAGKTRCCIMPGALRETHGRLAQRFFIRMVARIPAPDRHVDPAAECHFVVDHQQLHMMR
ncbi:hypothetical protein D3C87_1365330 [compost metagenome]